MSEHRSTETIAHVPVETQWVGGMLFDAGRANGPKVRIDADATSAPSPFDLLLAAIASCASTDLLTIFRKQRTPTRSLKVTVEATRVSATPRRLASAVLHFEIRGTGITLEKAKRAVELSVTKYCSVRSSLIADAPVTWTIDLKT
jgi:putative redox protein